jgi:hypothetical protein
MSEILLLARSQTNRVRTLRGVQVSAGNDENALPRGVTEKPSAHKQELENEFVAIEKSLMQNTKLVESVVKSPLAPKSANESTFTVADLNLDDIVFVEDAAAAFKSKTASSTTFFASPAPKRKKAAAARRKKRLHRRSVSACKVGEGSKSRMIRLRPTLNKKTEAVSDKIKSSTPVKGGERQIAEYKYSSRFLKKAAKTAKQSGASKGKGNRRRSITMEDVDMSSVQHVSGSGPPRFMSRLLSPNSTRSQHHHHDGSKTMGGRNTTEPFHGPLKPKMKGGGYTPKMHGKFHRMQMKAKREAAAKAAKTAKAAAKTALMMEQMAAIAREHGHEGSDVQETPVTEVVEETVPIAAVEEEIMPVEQEEHVQVQEQEEQEQVLDFKLEVKETEAAAAPTTADMGTQTDAMVEPEQSLLTEGVLALLAGMSVQKVNPLGTTSSRRLFITQAGDGSWQVGWESSKQHHKARMPIDQCVIVRGASSTRFKRTLFKSKFSASADRSFSLVSVSRHLDIICETAHEMDFVCNALQSLQ